MNNPRIRTCCEVPIGRSIYPNTSRLSGIGREQTVDQPAPAAITAPNRANRARERHLVNDAHSATLFGGACDRCGHLYLQYHFPDGCLCPRCFWGA
jgi:hypothetical protein